MRHTADSQLHSIGRHESEDVEPKRGGEVWSKQEDDLLVEDKLMRFYE